jgi:hypothetical protein
MIIKWQDQRYASGFLDGCDEVVVLGVVPVAEPDPTFERFYPQPTTFHGKAGGAQLDDEAGTVVLHTLIHRAGSYRLHQFVCTDAWLMDDTGKTIERIASPFRAKAA